ncbi:MAG: LLM class flavin-dependent oxidoreductase [Dehalococcoidia bacterium]|nr:LLM class flavin-dependent oxidoreductase [Dehalococcoidia bacterium]
MRAGIFSTIQTPPDERQFGPIRLLDRIVAAERAGFESVWLAERHFTPYGVIGNPVVFGAAVAARTSRIQIGFAALILALHHPVQLAEELVMLDTLSGGRVIIGVGSGKSQREYDGLGVDIEQRAARFDESVQLIRRVWQGDPFDHDGPLFPVRFPGLTMRPVQPTPRIVRAVVNDASIVRSAIERIPVLLGRFPVDTMARNLRLYCDTLQQTGASDDEIAALLRESGTLRHVVVAETDTEAEATAREGLTRYIENAKAVNEPHDFAPFYASAVVAGAPSTVSEQLASIAALGLGRILCWFDFGGLPFDVADHSVALFGQRVLPLLDRSPARV